MEILMTLMAWGMFIGMVAGAICGWLMFLIAWVDNLRINGRFDELKRRGRPRTWALFRRKQATETSSRSETWNTLL